MEDKLDDNETADEGMRFEYINTGISGANSTSPLALYNQEWLRLKPAITVINLSNSDKNKNTDWFAYNLETMMKA